MAREEPLTIFRQAHAFYIEELQDKYLMAKEKRIELFGERLLAIKEELAGRDLSDVPTPKLFDMMMKCQAALEKEETKTTFKTDKDVEDSKMRRIFTEERFEKTSQQLYKIVYESS